MARSESAIIEAVPVSMPTFGRDFLTRKSRLILLALLIVMAARIVSTYTVFNGTFDEGYHLMAGMEMYQTGKYQYRTENPPLVSMILAALPYASGVRARWDIDYIQQPLYVLEDAGSYWKTLTLARMGNLLFIPILMIYVYRWSCELYGVAAGLIAVLLVTNSPNVLAHAGVSAVDFAITATLIAAAYSLYRWAQDGGTKRLVIAACFVAFAVMSKYSAAGYLAVIGAAYFALARWRRFTGLPSAKLLGAGAARVLLFVAIVFTLVWACFGFDVGPVQDHHGVVKKNLDRYFPSGSRFSEPAREFALRTSLPAPAFFDGLAVVADHAREGHPGHFLLGEVKHREGWWYYFPVVLAVKTTLPFLGLLVLAAWVFCARGGPGRKGSVYVAIAAAVVLLFSMAGNLNIGVRHILPIYAFFAVLASSLFARVKGGFANQRALVVVALVLVAGHVATSLGAHPDYIPYFNEAVRGPKHRILGDSNLDWGQDVARLGRHLEANGIEGVIHYYCFGMTRPEAVGIDNYRVYDFSRPPKGWLAVSLTAMQGIYREPGQPSLEWLWDVTPRAKIGETILLYYFED